MNGSNLLWRRALGLALVLVFVFSAVGEASAAGGKVIYVKAGATGLNNGTSWANAFKSLQKALSVAVAGDQVWVAKGIYKPTSGTNRETSFRLKEGVKLLGGFAGYETKISQRKLAVNITVLSGDIGQAGVASDNSYHVVFGYAVSSLTVMDGFEISGGKANGPNPSNWGGGMLLDHGSPTLRNLTFRGNFAWESGGGMFAYDASDPQIINSSFIGNTTSGGTGGGSGSGGGMHLYWSAALLRNVTFSGNSASVAGGGIGNAGSSPTLINVTFYNNSAGTFGGGIYNVEASPTLQHVTMSGNTAEFGGGMSSMFDSVPVISNSIFWGNSATYDPQFHDASYSSQSITDSIVQGGCPAIGSCVNVLDANPKLGSPQKNGGATKTMALGGGSSAIDAGGVNVACEAKDQRGVSRPQGGKCDMGAYEVRAKTFTSIAAQDGFVVDAGENAGTGSLVNSVVNVLAVGDSGDNSQVRSILSFNTAALPDGASVALARVQVRAVTAPMLTLGKLLIDLKKPYFGTSANLQAMDFQARATVSSAGYLVPPLTGMLHTGTLNSSARLNINRTGLTQLRLRFMLDDDNDHVEDTLYVLSGESGTTAERPQLIVYYNP